MKKNMKERQLQFIKALSALTEDDITGAADYKGYTAEWTSYVLIGGNTPKPKPGRPLR